MYKKRTCRSFFCFIENTVFYKANHSVGSRCGGMELCRCCDPPQAENLASEILYFLTENPVSHKANPSVGSRCGGMELCRCCDLPQALYYLLERLQMFIFSASAISSSRKSG